MRLIIAPKKTDKGELRMTIDVTFQSEEEFIAFKAPAKKMFKADFLFQAGKTTGAILWDFLYEINQQIIKHKLSWLKKKNFK